MTKSAVIGKNVLILNSEIYFLPIKLYNNNLMIYISVTEFAQKNGIAVRTVRNYCAIGKIKGAFLTGKTWNIPVDAQVELKKMLPQKTNNKLLNVLKEQKEMQLKGGIYHKIQVDFTFNSNKIEGSRLTQEQTRYIFETNTVGIFEESINVDDIIETTNHFRCIDLIIEKATSKLTESIIKELHFILKSGTSESRKSWFNVGSYKKLPNEVGGNETCKPQEVEAKMRELLINYNNKNSKTLKDIIDFHQKFEVIHPFQDGNGRVGRLIVFKECLANNIVPFLITDDLKLFYYRGLQQWDAVQEYLMDTCLTAQDNFKSILNYFKIEHN